MVAASSRPKALAAWGANQELFKTGGSRETDDPDLVRAASAQPGEVLRRPSDSKVALAALAKHKPQPRKAASQAAVSKVAALEAQLEDLGSRSDTILSEIEAERHAMQKREAAARARLDAEEAKLAAALKKARLALS